MDTQELCQRITEFLGGKATGHCTDDDDEYDSLIEMWEAVGILSSDPQCAKKAKSLSPSSQEEYQQLAWYSQAYDYWEDEKNCQATVDGVLGGFGNVSEKDVQASLQFIKKIKSTFPQGRYQHAVDCGAGIGRVTKHVLLNEFNEVDLLEQSPRLIKAAAIYINEKGGDTTSQAESRVNYLCLGMQDFHPKEQHYDVIWIQWCIGHLHDLDLYHFLHRCRKGLQKEGGMVVVKDNCCTDADFVVDKRDSSITRSASYLKAVFAIAGFELCLEESQKDFPSELFPVIMFAFRPALPNLYEQPKN